VPDPIGEREDALRVQLDGRSPEATADEARVGIHAALEALRQGKGAGYGIGFGFVKALDSKIDGEELLFAVTDGEREASIVATVTGTTLASDDGPGDRLIEWAHERLYAIAGAFSAYGDRYAEVVLLHPVSLG
jgi:hypothetical protein